MNTVSPPIGGLRYNATQLETLQAFIVSSVVILLQTAAELLDSLLAGPDLRTFMQYSITFSSRPDTAIDVI